MKYKVGDTFINKITYNFYTIIEYVKSDDNYYVLSFVDEGSTGTVMYNEYDLELWFEYIVSKSVLDEKPVVQLDESVIQLDEKEKWGKW